MTSGKHFSPGQPVLIREIWQDKIWLALPAIVVRDAPDLTALYSPLATIAMIHKTPNSSSTSVDNLIKSDWVLEETSRQDSTLLKLVTPNTGYSIFVIMNADASLKAWYVNIEDFLFRDNISYNSTDLLLDVIISPDLSEWRWDDEDELEKVVEAGLISREKALSLYARGEHAVSWLQSGESPFNEWANWQPAPAWEIPVLPDGWDKI